jgi:hypothetical protein
MRIIDAMTPTENYILTLIAACQEAILLCEHYGIDLGNVVEDRGEQYRDLAWFAKAFEEARSGEPNRLRERMSKCSEKIRECEIGHTRYETVRLCNPAQFHALWLESMSFGVSFDKCVDNRIQWAKESKPFPYNPLCPAGNTELCPNTCALSGECLALEDAKVFRGNN